MNPNEPFTNPNLDEPRTTIIMGSNSREAAEALNALKAIKELHRKAPIYGLADDCAICPNEDDDRHYAIWRSGEWVCPETIEGSTCTHCMDGRDEYPEWPCATARAWGEK